MCEKEEQRVCIKFCFKIGKTATETFELLKMAYGNDVMGRTQVYEWFGRFSQGRVSCQSDPRSGRPSTSRNPEMVAKVCTLIRNDRRLTIREIAEECDISFPAKKARQVRSKTKVMLLVFFDHEGIVHYEFAPAGQTINKEYYVEVLKRLREAVRKKRPGLWASREWLLHHDGAPAHTAHLTQDFLAKNGITQVAQPPYSPDMAPCDFWLFPKLKGPLKGQRFEDVDSIKGNAARELKAIPKTDFTKCFQQWQQRWAKCVAAGGMYFEGD